MNRDVFEILKKINSAGFSAYIVGGSVRDILLNIEPKDYDITTSATPDEIKDIFKTQKILLHGEKYGTISVRYNGNYYEITTFRSDGEYLDGRRPKMVYFSKDLKEDLRRRDFTINAMAMDISKNLIDPFNGRNDLDEKILKAVGDSNIRIREDSLRILRAIRFATRFKLTIDDELFYAIESNRKFLKNISVERIFDEFSKILMTDTPSYGLLLMEELGILDILFPELKRTVGFDQNSFYHDKTLFDHIISVVDFSPKILELRLAALFHDISKVDTLSIDSNGVGHFFNHEIYGAKLAEEILKRYKVSNKLIGTVKILIKNHMKVHEVMTDRALRRQIKKVGRDKILLLYDLMIADYKATTIDRDSTMLEDRKCRIIELLEEDVIKKDNFLAINGKDIIELGYSEGKIIGEILKYLTELVIDEPSLNKREILIEKIKNKFSR